MSMLHEFLCDLCLNMLTSSLLTQLELSVLVVIVRSPHHNLWVALRMILRVRKDFKDAWLGQSQLSCDAT